MLEQSQVSSSQLLWTVEQAMEVLQVGRTKFYYLVKQEGLPLIRSGRWVRVSPEGLRRWIIQQQEAQK